MDYLKSFLRIFLTALILFTLSYFIFAYFPILAPYERQNERELSEMLTVYKYLFIALFWIYLIGVTGYHLILNEIKPRFLYKIIAALAVTFVPAFLSFNYGNFTEGDWDRVSWNINLTLAFGVIAICLVFVFDLFQRLIK